MARKIVRIQDGEWTGLAYNDDGFYPDDQLLPLGKPTAEEYAALCDQQAENANRHDFCGVHASLLRYIRAAVNEKGALAVMKDIAEHGGLWEL
jgi:hypothetical protein